MASSRIGRNFLVIKVQQMFNLSTKKEAEEMVNKFVRCLEQTLLDHIDVDKFSMKLNSFGKFIIRHKPGALRRIPFTPEIKMTDARRKVKFVSLGQLRRVEKKKEID